MTSSTTPHKSHRGWRRIWFILRSLFRLLHLFLSRACKTDIDQFPMKVYDGMYDLLNLEITCFEGC